MCISPLQAAPRANIYRRNHNAVDVRFAHSFDDKDVGTRASATGTVPLSAGMPC